MAIEPTIGRSNDGKVIFGYGFVNLSDRTQGGNTRIRASGFEVWPQNRPAKYQQELVEEGVFQQRLVQQADLERRGAKS